MHLRDSVLVVAQSALEEALLQFSARREILVSFMHARGELANQDQAGGENLRYRGHQSAVIADVDAERVRHVEQALLQE